MKATKVISIASSGLVFALAVVSFVLSYDNLLALAVGSGAIDARLGFLWPFVVDGALVVFSLAVLRNSLLGERALWPFALVVIFSAASVGLNIAHAPADLLARIIASVAPVALLLSFETLMSQVKSEVRRSGVSQTLRTMQEAVSLAQAELTDLGQQADNLSAQRDTLAAEIDTLKKERRAVKRGVLSANDTGDGITAGGFVPGDLEALGLANDTRQAQKETRQAQLVGIIESERGISYPDLAQRLGVSVATIKRDVAELSQAGRIKRNGHGLEPVLFETLAVSSEPVNEPVTN